MNMGFGHEKLDVYRLSISYVAWVYGKALDEIESRSRKAELDRMAAMLSRLGGRGYQVGEEQSACGSSEENDTDSDIDPDSDKGRELKIP